MRVFFERDTLWFLAPTDRHIKWPRSSLWERRKNYNYEYNYEKVFFSSIPSKTIKLEWGVFEGSQRPGYLGGAKTTVETKVRLPTHPLGAWVATKTWSSSHKDGARVMPQTGGFGCVEKRSLLFSMYRNQNIEQKWGVWTTWLYQKVEQYGGFPSVIISSGFDGTFKFHTL